ncbi:Zinc finger protein MAGPIE [Dendrobium catenatum]|uniref:Zinc finger protein MAGPIE n=1 Tax=Dendrobium catenatum TaxID=906689 RepID=A0A2I0WRK0_9ASPA|nr:Zinc finger protein MAGPIE [Dendrobium catenatum]
MATNRFICEICNKGFQRDQNLQLHRRGHNLPWKLRQRPPGGSPVRKRVFVCPEPTCVHHDPARALGDLTGIKKHFSRKHGEKKWKCDRCGKRYAVNSDYKAHSKTCGSREYRCDCGTLFSRKDSFVTHRAFCDALMQEPAAAAASMSATALLQKAAEMGVMASSSSSSSAFFSGLVRSMKGGGLEYGGGGMTRDFLGLGEEEEGAGSRSIEEMRRFASFSSGGDYKSTNATSSYNARG